MADYYHVGARAKLTATFTNAAKVAVDPDVVVMKYKNDAGTVTTLTYNNPGDDELVRVSTGVYSVEIDLDTHGKWLWRFHSTGTGKAAREGSLMVIDSQFD